MKRPFYFSINKTDFSVTKPTPLLTVNATITTLFYTATITYLPSIHPSLPYLLEEVSVYHITPIYIYWNVLILHQSTSFIIPSSWKDPSLVLGQRHNLSSSDIIRLNAHYSCPVTTTTEATTPTSTATTPSTTTQNPCSSGKVPNYADPTDCTRFYVCSGIKATLMVCPSGLYYNEINYVCDWPSNVYCPWDNL